MNAKNSLLSTLLMLGLLSPGSTSAQQSYSYPHAYISHIEGDLQIQSATELEPGEASANHPILPGDRVWTRTLSRAEIQFGDGTLLRMGEMARIDFTDFGENGSETLVRQWSGSLILRLSEERAGSFRLDTPAGTIYPASAGLFRIDIYDGGASTVVSVYEGVAELASEGGSVLIRSGQRSIVEPGHRPEPSFAFNTTQWDEFASWSDERNRAYRVTEHIEGIPRDVEVYAGNLQRHGTWRVDVDLGPVWYPSVSVDWYPYSQGHWSYTTYGYTWVPYEPWGWAPYHYGRWGYNHVGWYWIPGAHWGPAWVSWAIGPTWMGWCPLDYHDRPVHYHSGFPSRGGKAVPRGSVAALTRGDGWNFVQKEHFGRGSSSGKARLRASDIRATAHQAKVLESGAILDRSMRPSVVGAAAMTRLPKGGVAARVNQTEPGSPVSGRGVSSRGGNLTGNRILDESGKIQTGRARSRTQPGSVVSSGEARPTGDSALQKGSSLSSTARSRSSSRPTTTGNRIQRDPSSSQGKPLGTQGGAISRRNETAKGGDRTGTLTQGRSRVMTQPSGRTSNSAINNPTSSDASQTPARNRSSVGRRLSNGSTSSSQESGSSPAARRGERSPRSQVPTSSNSPATEGSRSRPSQPSGPPNRVERSDNRGDSSVRGRRSIYDRVTRNSRPQTDRVSPPSRSQPSAKPPSSRPQNMGTPSQPSSPPRSSSSGQTRSTRSRTKKK